MRGVYGRAVRGLPRGGALLVPVLLLALTGCGGDGAGRAQRASGAPGASGASGGQPDGTASQVPTPPASPSGAPELPLGGRTIFPGHRVVAFYGTAGYAGLGVLGEADPDSIVPRLRAAAAGFATPDRKLQIAFELIVTVAQRRPGADGAYSKMIDQALIRQYVDAARRHGALLVLDVQPGRADFLTQVKRLRPFLSEPHVGLALDPEWRMAPGQIPGKVTGAVGAAEINAVAAYLSGIVTERNLPQKLLLLHQFKAAMIPDIAAVAPQRGLAIVHHLDGFGTRGEKAATFNRLYRPGRFHLGYKLFYDEDVGIYTPAEVLAFQHVPDYVSYQ
jgi:hypothetical protein